MVPSEIKDFIKRKDCFCLVIHIDPDGDCVTSALALESFLKRNKKEVFLYCQGPFRRPEIKNYKNLFSQIIPESIKEKNPGVIILDCSTIERIGSLAQYIEGLEIAVIDHHDSGEPFGNIKYINSKAPSVTFLIHKLIESMDSELTEKEANLLLLGFCTDTGFFRHLDQNSGKFVKSVGDLIDAGASLKESFKSMYGNRPFNSRILTGRLLSRLEKHFNDRVFYTYQKEEEIQELGSEAMESDQLYQMIFGTEGCEAVIFIREGEEGKGTCTVGLRSLYDIDVGKIAHTFGGGGHKNAAGFTFQGSLEYAFNSVKKEFLKIL